MVVALSVTALGALLVLGTSRPPRWSAGGARLTGGGVPAAGALALVALAGVGLLLLARGPARSAVGVLLVLCGVAVVLIDVLTASARQGGLFAYAPLDARQLQAHRSVWFWLTAAGGVGIAVGGAMTTARGHRWPSSRRDYAAPGQTLPAHTDAWTAIDRGEDPTL
ncbi:MAG: hypothetical protein QOI54_1337 [Actinomycetota bacterium]|jgi:hypothetical protein|nr:hypothetical protein [Actinomycetota bacterium]